MKWLCVAALVALAGCGAAPVDAPAAPTESGDVVTLIGGRMTRYIDREAGVACWVINGGGLDCLPLDQTRLSGAEEE